MFANAHANLIAVFAWCLPNKSDGWLRRIAKTRLVLTPVS